MSRDVGYPVGNPERRERGHPDGWFLDRPDPGADTASEFEPRRRGGGTVASGEHDRAEKD